LPHIPLKDIKAFAPGLIIVKGEYAMLFFEKK